MSTEFAVVFTLFCTAYAALAIVAIVALFYLFEHPLPIALAIPAVVILVLTLGAVNKEFAGPAISKATAEETGVQ